MLAYYIALMTLQQHGLEVNDSILPACLLIRVVYY